MQVNVLVQFHREKYDLCKSEADSGFVKLVVMTNVFFNNQQHEIKTKQCISMKQKKPSFFSNNRNQLFYSKICKT